MPACLPVGHLESFHARLAGFKTGFFLDYNVIHLNVGLITYGESFSAVPVGTTEAIVVALSYPVFLWIVSRRRLHDWYQSVKPGHLCVRFLRAVGMGLILYSVLFGETHTTDSMTEIFRSMLRVDPLQIAIMDVKHLESIGIRVDDPFPLVRREGPVPATRDGTDALPHVIVVALESYNARYLFKNCTSCDPSLGPSTEFTPHLNRFARENSYSTKFYGNSVQTARSHIAIHCGILPSWRGKIFTDHSSLNVRCLPRILGEVGYHSLFWSTQESLAFDNEGPAMRNMVGFERAESMNAGRARDKTKEWGMGWQDDESYHAFFQYLDEHVANDTKPWYSFMTTVSHHMHFDRVPESEKRLFPHIAKHSMRQKFEDSIHAADRYFGDFLALLAARPWLKDAIVIVLGDHSYPNGEHSNFYNDFGGFEENFRVPLAIRVPASMKERVSAGPLPVEGGSQVDLPPTVLDLLQVHTTHSFFGSSLLLKHVEDSQLKGGRRPTVMVQPYAGVYFIAVRWPYKLRFDFQTKKHVLTDLEEDPEESHNLYGAHAVAEIQAVLQQDLSVPLISQQLIQANRVFPASL
jgi:hypothetical protein